MPPGVAAKRQKVLILLVGSRHCGELIRGLQNLESTFWEGFNFVSGKLLFGWVDSRFVKPRKFPKRERFLLLFAACKK